MKSILIGVLTTLAAMAQAHEACTPDVKHCGWQLIKEEGKQ